LSKCNIKTGGLTINKRTICIASPYSFEGSVIDFEELFEWASEKDVSNVILSDTTLCGVGSFLLAARKYERLKRSWD